MSQRCEPRTYLFVPACTMIYTVFTIVPRQKCRVPCLHIAHISSYRFIPLSTGLYLQIPILVHTTPREILRTRYGAVRTALYEDMPLHINGTKRNVLCRYMNRYVPVCTGTYKWYKPWIVRQQLLFTCTLRPPNATIPDRYKRCQEDITLNLVFFSAFEDLRLQTGFKQIQEAV